MLCVCVVTVKEGYNVGSDVTVTLEFRSSSQDGVLLGISSRKVDAIGLELINGQVCAAPVPAVLRHTTAGV